MCLLSQWCSVIKQTVLLTSGPCKLFSICMFAPYFAVSCDFFCCRHEAIAVLLQQIIGQNLTCCLLLLQSLPCCYPFLWMLWACWDPWDSGLSPCSCQFRCTSLRQVSQVLSTLHMLLGSGHLERHHLLYHHVQVAVCCCQYSIRRGMQAAQEVINHYYATCTMLCKLHTC